VTLSSPGGGKAGWKVEVALEDDGTFNARASCGLKHPQVLGIIQTPIEKLLGP
jgi:hypothetical protein